MNILNQQDSMSLTGLHLYPECTNPKLHQSRPVIIPIVNFLNSRWPIIGWSPCSQRVYPGSSVFERIPDLGLLYLGNRCGRDYDVWEMCIWEIDVVLCVTIVTTEIIFLQTLLVLCSFSVITHLALYSSVKYIKKTGDRWQLWNKMRNSHVKFCPTFSQIMLKILAKTSKTTNF